MTLLSVMIFYDSAGLSGGDMIEDRLRDGKCKFHSSNLAMSLNLIENCYSEYGPATIILGDSHALNIYNSYYLGSAQDFIVGLSLGGCRPYADNPECFYSEFREFVIQNPQMVDRVIFHQSGSHLISDRLNRVDQSLPFQPGESYNIRIDLIIGILNYVESLIEYAKVIWLGPFIDAWNEPTYPNLFFGNLDIKQKNIDVFTNLEGQIMQLLKDDFSEVKYVSLIDALGAVQYQGRVNGCVVWRDWDHWSLCGEKVYAQRVSAAIEGAFAK
jgi:hypothetical protein